MRFQKTGYHGLYFPDLGISLDGYHPKAEFTLVSHAHADHIPRNKKTIAYATEPTLDLIKFRGFNGHNKALRFGETFDTSKCSIKLYPAVHILGSAMILIQSDDGDLLFTGDYRTPPSPATEGFEAPDHVDFLITEATFGLPIYKWKRDEKEIILRNIWSKMTPVEIKYFLRLLSRGSLRIGFEQRSVISSIATAFHQEKEEVRYVHMITGSIGKTAVLAKENRLDEARFRMFHPLAFMLASPIDNRSVDSIEAYIAEEKFDGIRAQVHVEGERICIYSRDLNEVTNSFPEIVRFFREREMPSCVLDGEICLYKDDIIMPFQRLQKRLGIKKPGKKILKTHPVLFISYDLLFTDGNPVFDKPLTERRKILESVAEKFRIPVTTQHTLKERKDLDMLFEKAIENGNEGLMLKHKKSLYEYGQRKKSWLKVKKPGGSFDTVIMYAHAGSGRRGGTYSDFTLGISVQNDERYEERFIPIGKAYDGYTDEELRKLNSRIKELTVEKYGPTLGLLPELVVEIEFDDIQVNKRTKAGYTLRFPRFRAIRWDLGPEDVDTLQDVERAYAKKLEREPLPQKMNPSFIFM